ncbi:MAG TPA: KilA-N domain-containing protein [Candidatus Saccharimonadales bacterium]|nr:KilA-N domain-containing protein [Candidatus Saccharimonadales bacterium]
MGRKTAILTIGEASIKVIAHQGGDYICLTDMVKNYGGDQAIYSWMRNRNTVEFLGIWETLNNPDFKGGEFETFRKQAGLNAFHLTPKKWSDATDAIGIVSKPGRHNGGTYAHKDIAFEFGTWLSPEFKLYLIKEFQRLKETEAEQERWDYRRFLTKVNYVLQTDAVQQMLIPRSALPLSKAGVLFAEEADIINLALFGTTAKEWRIQNPALSKKGNIRDYATIEQLTVLSNLESMNSMFITQDMNKQDRFDRLQAEAVRQLSALIKVRKTILPPDEDVPGLQEIAV